MANHLEDDSLGLCAERVVEADDFGMDNLLRTAILASLPGAIPLGVVILSSLLRPVPVLIPSVPREAGRNPRPGR